MFDDPRIDVGGPSVNPVTRVLPHHMIETGVPMIDVFNCLVESQKIPIFSVAGEPFNQLLARIGMQANADVIVFGGLGLIFDDYHYFRTTFQDEGVFARTVMFVNQASDPLVEQLFVPDMCLKVAERFAIEQSKRVLVLFDGHDVLRRRPQGDRDRNGAGPFQSRLHGGSLQPVGGALRACMWL